MHILEKEICIHQSLVVNIFTNIYTHQYDVHVRISSHKKEM